MNQKMSELKYALREARQRGNTRYLLSAAIEMPDVTIVAANSVHAAEMEKQYKKMLEELSWWKKALRKMKGLHKKSPKFIPVRELEKNRGIKPTPMIMDLYSISSCL